MTPRISRSRGGETAIDPDELSRELLTDVGVSAPGRYAGQVERLDAGTIGKIYHYRGTYLQDWIVDPAFPRVWRLVKSKAGSGSGQGRS